MAGGWSLAGAQPHRSRERRLEVGSRISSVSAVAVQSGGLGVCVATLGPERGQTHERTQLCQAGLWQRGCRFQGGGGGTAGAHLKRPRPRLGESEGGFWSPISCSSCDMAASVSSSAASGSPSPPGHATAMLHAKHKKASAQNLQVATFHFSALSSARALDDGARTRRRDCSTAARRFREFGLLSAWRPGVGPVGQHFELALPFGILALRLYMGYSRVVLGRGSAYPSASLPTLHGPRHVAPSALRLRLIRRSASC